MAGGQKRRGEGEGLGNAMFRSSDLILDGWCWRAFKLRKQTLALEDCSTFSFLLVLKLYHITCSSNKILEISLISKLGQSGAAQLRLRWKTQNFSARPPPQLFSSPLLSTLRTPSQDLQAFSEHTFTKRPF